MSAYEHCWHGMRLNCMGTTICIFEMKHYLYLNYSNAINTAYTYTQEQLAVVAQQPLQ